MAAADGDALAIYGADKLTNVDDPARPPTQAKATPCATNSRSRSSSRLEVWEADLALLREKAPELPFLDELETELSLLRARLEAPAPPPA